MSEAIKNDTGQHLKLMADMAHGWDEPEPHQLADWKPQDRPGFVEQQVCAEEAREAR